MILIEGGLYILLIVSINNFIKFPSKTLKIIPLISIGLFIVFTGLKWQFIPIYLVSVLLPLHKKDGGRALNLSVLFCTMVTLVLLYAFPIFQLPGPEGSHSVGTDLHTVSFNSRIQGHPFGTDRKIGLQIWYPAEDSLCRRARYWLKDRWGTSNVYAEFLSEWQYIPSISISHLGLLGTNSFYMAKVKEGPFPLIVYSHGYPVDPYNSNQVLFEHLASSGFIVASIAHSHETPFYHDKTLGTVKFDITNPELKARNDELMAIYENETYWNLIGTDSIEIQSKLHKEVIGQVPNLLKSAEIWHEDIKATINFLTNHGDLGKSIDSSSIGIMGFSFGGSNATTYGLEEDCVDAIVNLDGFLYYNLDGLSVNKPHLMLYSSGNHNMNNHFLGKGHYSEQVTIENSKHINFTDYTFFGPWTSMFGIVGEVDSCEFRKSSHKIIASFFERNLKD